MFRTFLSWRYLVSRRTNLIGIVGIFVAVGALILILSIMTGFLDESRRFIRGSLADIVIAPQVPSMTSNGGPAASPEPILALLAEDERIAAAAPHLGWIGAVIDEGQTSLERYAREAASTVIRPGVVSLVGIDLERELAATDFGLALRREELYGERVADPDDPFARPPMYAPSGRPKASAILGDQLMMSLRARIGQEINIGVLVPDTQTGELRESNRKFVVAGSFRSGHNETDASAIYVERSELVALIGGLQSFAEVLVKLKDYGRDKEAVREDIRILLREHGLIGGEGYEVGTWEDYRRSVLGAIENERVLMAIMLSLVLLVAGFTVFAILSMMVTEKRRDIGILSAIGATPRGILSLFFWIGLWDALIGCTLGAVFGIWAALRIDSIERWLSSTFRVEIFDRSVYLFDHIPARVQPEAVAAIVLGALFATLLFSAIPAWRASRLDPLEALRHE